MERLSDQYEAPLASKSADTILMHCFRSQQVIKRQQVYNKRQQAANAGTGGGHRTGRPRGRRRRAASTQMPPQLAILAYLSLLCASVYLFSQPLASVAQQSPAPTQSSIAQSTINKLPDLTSATSDEPIVAIVGQDAFVSCVAKNLQNYTIIWRYTNDANAPAAGEQTGAQTLTKQSDEQATIITAGRQRVISDDRFSVIQSHDTWLLKISNVRLSDTGTYICHTNSEPRVRALRIMSVVKPGQNNEDSSSSSTSLADTRTESFSEIDYDFSDCCRLEYVAPRCQRLCSFQQLASRYQGINIVHECFSSLPSITRCMVAGRNVTDCCQKRHIPSRCNAMCGHQGDTSAMSVQDQSYCADYSASIMSCVAEGMSTLPGQPELVIVEAVSSTTLKVSWQKVANERELRKIDGWIINLTKLSSFEDTISTSTAATSSTNAAQKQLNKQASASNSQVSDSSSRSSSSSTSGQAAQMTTTTTTTTASAGGNSPTAPLASLTIVDVMNNSSLAAMTKLLAASSGTISLKLDKHTSEFSIDSLKPYTVYQVQMFAYNSLGRSQLTDPIRALTLAPESAELSTTTNTEPNSSAASSADVYVEPTLPDTRKCCLDRGVTLKRCLDTLCDPVEADRANIADLMICAPWSNITFSCLSSRVNHTDCCKARGVSPFCLSMCSGDVKRVDYRHFRCLTHMSTYTNCILESHNVLPSPPQNFTVGPITHTWAVLNWRPPKRHARYLQGYRIFWRRVEPANSDATASNNSSSSNRALMGDLSASAALTDEFLYSSAEAATNPYLLDALAPETVYETFVVAVNKYGQSDSSARFIFQTLADPEKVASLNQADKLRQGDVESRLPLHGGSSNPDAIQSYYNETNCCLNSGVQNNCLQLCDYDLKVSDVSSLITTCNNQMPVILRCMAGSRNSVPCCRNRGVNDRCLNVCAGLTETSPLVVATRCGSDFGKIIRCMDEGSRLIPSAPVDLHTTDVRSDRVAIKWAPAKEDALRADVEYHIRYQQLQQAADQQVSASDLSSLIAVVPLHPLEHNLVQTTRGTEATIDKLKPNSRYSIYVTAENPHGISLPSLVLVVQTPPDDDQSRDEFKRKATLGAPHSLEVLRSDTDSIVLKWIAPLFSNADAKIRYRVFYKMLAPSPSPNDTQTSPAAANIDESATTTATPQPVQQVASNWTVLETSDTTILLRNLRYSSQYVITVQAYSKQLLGHMSEILLASTAKPVPPTLNHPLVINNPVEGNNITIMCVALGQPTPQISMFINGLLVQKRTQPYVIYHLVNLVRGHLTITCFASNGQGKDYASVQSRTEISVKFASKAVAKIRQVKAMGQQATSRLSCEVSGNPQPTVIWTFTAAGKESTSAPKVITPNERITTLLVSQFENPFTWSHTLTIRNVSQSDAGTYQCRARNLLAESSDSIQLTLIEQPQLPAPDTPGSSVTGDGGATTAASSSASYLRQVEANTDLMECCRSQNVSEKCLPACSADGLDVEAAFKIPECQGSLDKLMYCAADGSDHRNCCRTRQVPSSCLRWCSGAKLNIPALCFLSSAIDINQCFQEGRTLLPGPPRNVRVMLASDSEHGELETGSLGSGQQPATEMTTTSMSGSLLFSASSPSTSSADKQTANSDTTGSNNPSVISSMVMMMGDQTPTATAMAVAPSSQSAVDGTTSEPNSDSQHSEPLIIEWDPPTKNPELVQYYRIFWRPFGSRELSRTVTNLTWIKLNDLNMNRAYEFVVKAANTHGSSVYSDPLTVKPSEILANSNSIRSAGLIWFMPSTSSGSLFGRVTTAICFATMFMFGSLALVMLLEKRGYLKRFASSKSNSSRISFANPAYLKNSDGNQDGDNITWETTGHSLDVLTLSPPPPLIVPVASNENETTNQAATSATNGQTT